MVYVTEKLSNMNMMAVNLGCKIEVINDIILPSGTVFIKDPTPEDIESGYFQETYVSNEDVIIVLNSNGSVIKITIGDFDDVEMEGM